MFIWSHESTTVADVPLQAAWNFICDPSNWHKWIDSFASIAFEGEVKTGSRIKMKIKDKKADVDFFITEVKPYCECKSLIKVIFFTQEASCSFQEVSPGRTQITMKTCVISLFAPFMKSFFLKKAEKADSKCIEALLEHVSKETKRLLTE